VHSKALRATAERIVSTARREVLNGIDAFEEAIKKLDKFTVNSKPEALELD
jgi:hypothetical protein